MYSLDIVLLRHGSTNLSESDERFSLSDWKSWSDGVRGTVKDQTNLVWEKTFIWHSCYRHQNRWQNKALCHHCNINGTAYVTSNWKIKEYHGNQAGFLKNVDIFQIGDNFDDNIFRLRFWKPFQENFISKMGPRFRQFFRSQETQKSSVRVSARSPGRKWRLLRQWRFQKDKMR